MNYRIIKDEATFLTALRTGKLDILEGIRWIAVEHPQGNDPPSSSGNAHSAWQGRLWCYAWTPSPFDDIRVRPRDQSRREPAGDR